MTKMFAALLCFALFCAVNSVSGKQSSTCVNTNNLDKSLTNCNGNVFIQNYFDTNPSEDYVSKTQLNETIENTTSALHEQINDLTKRMNNLERKLNLINLNPSTEPVQNRSGPYLLYSYNFRAFVIGRKNHNSDLWIVTKKDERFYILSPGLTKQAGTVSFESASKPGYFFTQQQTGLVNLLQFKNSTSYKEHSTFVPRKNKYYDGYTVYESGTTPNSYIRHQGYRIKVSLEDNSSLLHRDASFQPRNA